MKISLHIQGRQIPIHQPEREATALEAKDDPCPKCGRSPLRVAGGRSNIASHDTYEATAVCLDCRERVGVIRVQVSTIFGLEEDERVLNGRCRVY